MLVRKDDHWNEELDIPDIRNWRVVDADDRPLGFVGSVVVDPDAMALEAVLIGANERFAADGLQVHDGFVRLRTSIDVKSTRDAEITKSHTTFDEAFRDHFQRMFSGEDRPFDALKEAYTFGRVMALDADFTGRGYARAQEDLRGHWVSSRRKPPYEQVEEAVAFAYDITHRMGEYRVAGMERERHQILGRKERPDDDSKHAAEHMKTGSPSSESSSDL